MEMNFKETKIQIASQTKDIVLHLKVPLTNEQRTEMSDQIAQAVEEVAEGQNELKFVSTEIKARIQSSEAKLRELANKIRAGYEMKPVDCVQTMDYSNGSVIVHRRDTGERVSERAMTAEERQPELPIEEKKDEGD